VDMFVLEFEHVEVDYCYECGGVWLDSGELALVGERAGALKADLLAALESEQATRHTREGKRRCPVCRKPMAEVTTDTDPPIVLDRCPREHGLWFDRGELSVVVAAAGADEANVLARFFADLGGEKATEQS